MDNAEITQMAGVGQPDALAELAATRTALRRRHLKLLQPFEIIIGWTGRKRNSLNPQERRKPRSQQGAARGAAAPTIQTLDRAVAQQYQHGLQHGQAAFASANGSHPRP